MGLTDSLKRVIRSLSDPESSVTGSGRVQENSTRTKASSGENSPQVRKKEQHGTKETIEQLERRISLLEEEIASAKQVNEQLKSTLEQLIAENGEAMRGQSGEMQTSMRQLEERLTGHFTLREEEISKEVQELTRRLEEQTFETKRYTEEVYGKLTTRVEQLQETAQGTENRLTDFSESTGAHLQELSTAGERILSQISDALEQQFEGYKKEAGQEFAQLAGQVEEVQSVLGETNSALQLLSQTTEEQFHDTELQLQLISDSLDSRLQVALERNAETLQTVSAGIDKKLDVAIALEDNQKRFSEQLRHLQEVTEAFRLQQQDLSQETEEKLGALAEASGKQQEQLSQHMQQLCQLNEAVKGQVSVEELNGAVDGLREDLVDRIHRENVKCYRNVRTEIMELAKSLEEVRLDQVSMREIHRPMRGARFLSFFAIIDCAGIVFIILYMMGFLSF